MSELPIGWESTTLGKIAVWGSGGTPSRSEPSFYGGGIPWIKTGELGPRVVTSTEESISEEGLSKSSAKLFPAGSVAIAMYGATIGKTSILGISAATNQACAVGIPHTAATTKEYLYHFLCSQKEVFVDAGKGGAQPNISQAIIKDWSLPLAPLPEQKRIADKLDSVLARVDACRDRLDRLPALLKRFRQSILAAATSGRLTEDWRCPTKPTAQEHPQLTHFRDQLLWKLPNTWSWQPFSEIASVASDLRAPRDFLSAIHLAPNHIESGTGRILGCVTIAEDKVTSPKHLFRAGQIVYSKIRPNLCKVAIPDFSGLCSADMYPIETPMNPKYLWLWMLSQQFTDWASNAESRTVLPKINQVQLSKIPVPVPPPAEQTEIVRRVELLFAFADRLEARLAAARRQVGQLTPALLAKAFRGELVAQNPADEPAAELLKRLAAQREAAPKARRGRASKA